MGDREGKLCVVVQQPALPKYRLPVFRELASRSKISLRVVYGSQGELENVDSDCFESESSGPVRRLPLGLMWNGAQIRLAGSNEIDTLVLEWNARLLSLPVALIRARLKGIRTVVWGHGYSKKENWFRSTLRHVLGRMADGQLFYNRTTAQRYIEQYGFSSERVFVAPNALDQEPIREAREACLADGEAMDRFKSDRGITGPMILYVSRLLPENRADYLIHAVADLQDRVPGLVVGIVGSGPDEEVLRALAKERGIEHKVLFAGAVYRERELAPWFCSASVFCYPENIGLSLLHAFGHGLPVVTSDKIEAQNPEIEAFRDGENGLFYRNGDRAGMAEVIYRLLTDAKLNSTMSQEALATVEERYSLEKMIDGFENAVLQTAKRTEKSRR